MRSASRAAAILVGIVLTGAGARGQAPEEAAPPRPAPAKGQAAPRKASRNDGPAATLQAEVEVRYLRLQGLMTKLLEAIDKAQETGRVASALERAEELKVAERLRGIQSLLGGKDYRSALDEEKAVEKDLERILRILKGLDEAEELKRAAEELEALKDDLERLEKLSVDEEKHLEETRGLDAESLSADDPRAKEESSLLSRKQRDTQRKADALRKSLDREGGEERKDAQAGEEGEKGAGEEGQEGEGKEGGGKEGGKQGGKSGQGKQGGKSGQGKSGQAKSGQGKQAGGKQGQAKEGDSSQGEESQGQASAGKKSGASSQKDRRQARATSRTKAARALRRASEDMEGASQRLQAGNLKGAEEDQEEALAELEQAAEDLQEEIAEREEENQEELARRLAQRLEAMLAEQEIVSLETKHADRRAAAGDVEPEPSPKAEKAEDAPKAKDMEEPDAEPVDPRSLARRERSLMTDAEDALRILEADQTSVSAPSIIERVRDDLGNVATLLDGGETGEVTQLLQGDIERTLRELIDALTPPELPPGPDGQPQQPRPRPRGKRKDLVTPAMEIKMLRASQQRLRERTEKLEELGLIRRKDAEPAPEPAGDAEPLEQQARKLAEAQSKLAGLMDSLVAKYPVIDQLLLGAENELGEENREPMIPLLPPPPEEGGGGTRLDGSPGEKPPEKGNGDESSR